MAHITRALRPVFRSLTTLILALAAAASVAGPGLAQKLPPGMVEPLVLPAAPVGTCEFANATLQAAVDGYWAMPRQAAPAQLVGQTQIRRYDGMPAASMRGKAKSFRSVKAEYERRVANLSACVVTIHGRPYGLEAMIQTKPVDDEATEVNALFRLRDAPEYLANLRIHVQAYWSMSAWTSVAAGYPSGFTQGSAREAYEAEKRVRRAGLTWTPVSTAPAGTDPLAPFGAEEMLSAGDELAALAKDETDVAVNWRVRVLPLYDAACRRGSMLGCGRKGVLMSDGVGGVLPEQARPYLEKGCAVKDPESCFKLADGMRGRYANDETLERTKAMIFEACEGGSGAACSWAASSLRSTTAGATPDWPRIVKLYDRGCSLRNGSACLYGGRVYYEGAPGVPKDLKHARDMLTVGCMATGTLMGDACRAAGTMYAVGQGGEPVEMLAKLMLLRGCNKLDATSCKAINRPPPP